MSLALRTSRRFLLGLLAGTVLYGAPLPLQAQSAPLQWQGVEHVVAFADVHGAYDELHQLLRDSSVIDAQDHWAAGTTHVVSLGDLLDRGTGSRRIMDLLMRLQGEATAAGGRLHVLLGNHEAMNLLGDLRYVDPARVRRVSGSGVGHRAPGSPRCLGQEALQR